MKRECRPYQAKGPLPVMLAAGLVKTDPDRITSSDHAIVTRLPVHQHMMMHGQQAVLKKEECMDEI
jgi:hypothetical protein